MGFLEIILIIVAVFYLTGILGRYLLRRFIARKQKEFEERFGQGQGGYYKQYTWGSGNKTRNETAEEGEIKITATGKTTKKINSQVGDYVEYTEIEEKTENNSGQ
ncbi:MAG: DUF4834 family protein [Rikenellaceae bacterium]|nr:DUF4834 family protein [Rikenellaceae bacterium]